jgi:hypothetical protein
MDSWQIYLGAILGALPLILFLLLRNGKTSDVWRRRLPPGPPCVPVLGSVVLLTNSLADVEPLLRRLTTRYGPVVSLRVGSNLSIFAADRRLAHAALVECGAALADRPTLSTSTLLGENGNTITRASYGPVWRLLRRNLVAETLHPSRVRLFAPARSWVRRLLIEKLRDDSVRGEAVAETFQYAMFCLLLLMCFGERLDEAAVRAIAAAERDHLLYITWKMGVFDLFPSLTKHLFRGRLQSPDSARHAAAAEGSGGAAD